MTNTPKPRVDVCLCTYQRSSIAATLQSLARQTTTTPFRVIVADNDEAPSAQTRVLQEAARLNLNVLYMHAPARNISVARNACLEAAEAEFVAFIDDDETAADDWLFELMAQLDRRRVSAVFGPICARYGPDAPSWMTKADVHSYGAVVLKDGSVRTGYTSNALVRRAVIGQERFDLALGRSGGEDTEFFYRLHRQGAAFAEAPLARVFEPVPSDRARLGWLLRRSFRSGQTHGRLLLADGRRRGMAAAIAAAKALACGGLAAATAARPSRSLPQLIRGALHVGAAHRLLVGAGSDLQLYR